MKSIIIKMKYLAISLSAFFVMSCNFMDIVPDMIATIEDNAFSMRSQAEKYFFTCYSYMPNFGDIGADPALMAGDEIWCSDEYGSATTARNMAKGNQVTNNPYLDYWCGINSGKRLYRGISDCNIFLANIGRVPDISEAERNRWRAEVEVLKVFYHFYLTRMYGPIPIKDFNLSVQDDTETTHVFRNTLDECFAYMSSKMDSIIRLKHLPDFHLDEASEFGRITQGIALMIKAKILLTGASPLFNGNTDYIGLKDKRDIEIFNPVKTEEEKRNKWIEAAQACKEALEFFQGYKLDTLYHFRDVTLSDITNQILGIRGAMTERYPYNPEIIWANTNNWPTGYQDQAHPRDFSTDRQNNQTSNRNNHAVPMKITNWFYTKNGVPIEEDKTWDYVNRFNPRLIGDDHRYLLYVGGTTAGINFNRELRYYASFGFDQGIWYGQGNPIGVTAETTQHIEGRRGGYSANTITHSWNVTGIWPKKCMHYRTSFTSSTTVNRILYPFPIFRMADLYLMYAEAMNEAYNTQDARNEAILYIDKVRTRAGLKGVAESWTNYSVDPGKYMRQNGLRDIIRQEITIEFVFEGHRFWDVRRWKTAMDEYNKPITGWNLLYSRPEEYYTETYIYARRFTPRDYFWPIHDGEILRNSNTLQNYGW